MLFSWGDRFCSGGEKGPGPVLSTFAELALRALSFSARSARKKMSSGDSSLAVARAAKGRRAGVPASESDAGGDGSWLVMPDSLCAGESEVVLAMKLGMGREDGAGEAWNVAPAKAVADGGCLGPAVCGGVLLPDFGGPGETETFLGRDLALLRLADLEFAAIDPGAGLPGVDFWGVAGPPRTKSGWKGVFAGMSFSEA